MENKVDVDMAKEIHMEKEMDVAKDRWAQLAARCLPAANASECNRLGALGSNHRWPPLPL